MASTQDPTTLTNTFTHQSSTHISTIQWTTLGPENAPPLIFIHGTPWSSRVWAPFALALSSRFRIYLFDNPGYGQSPGRKPISSTSASSEDDLNVSLAGQAETFGALYHECFSFSAQNPPHVIAHDNGGLISLRANLLHGCVYASLMLIDVVAVRPFGSPFFRLVAQNAEVFRQIPPRVFEGMVRAYIRGAAYKPLTPEVEDMLVRPWLDENVQPEEGFRQGQAAFIRQMVQSDQRHAEEVEPRYAEVGEAMPVRIIWGKNDVWIPVDRATKLANAIGTQDVVLVDDAGHLIMYDQPVRLGVEVATWLSEVVGRRTNV